MNIKDTLIAMGDRTLRDFNARLIPGIDSGTILGIPTPCLRELASRLWKSGEADSFILKLPHEYFEENQLHAFILSHIRDFDTAICALERFLPYVDNWATCDQLIIPALTKRREALLPYIYKWLADTHTYTVRFAIGLLMRYFLDEYFEEKYLYLVADIRSDEYYINMMAAWYFATALAKQYDTTLQLFKSCALPTWVHNKSISKARESLRVSEVHKAELKRLKISKNKD